MAAPSPTPSAHQYNDNNYMFFVIKSQDPTVYADPQRFIYLLRGCDLDFVKTFCILAPIIYE